MEFNEGLKNWEVTEDRKSVMNDILDKELQKDNLKHKLFPETTVWKQNNSRNGLRMDFLSSMSRDITTESFTNKAQSNTMYERSCGFTGKREIEELKSKIDALEERIRTRRILDRNRNESSQNMYLYNERNNENRDERILNDKLKKCKSSVNIIAKIKEKSNKKKIKKEISTNNNSIINSKLKKCTSTKHTITNSRFLDDSFHDFSKIKRKRKNEKSKNISDNQTCISKLENKENYNYSNCKQSNNKNKVEKYKHKYLMMKDENLYLKQRIFLIYLACPLILELETENQKWKTKYKKTAKKIDKIIDYR